MSDWKKVHKREIQKLLKKKTKKKLTGNWGNLFGKALQPIETHPYECSAKGCKKRFINRCGLASYQNKVHAFHAKNLPSAVLPTANLKVKIFSTKKTRPVRK